jgi:cytoskeletal protein RodZ
MIEELCAQLKEKRKKLGYTIEEVVEKTKLHPSALHDMEEGNLHNINPTYLKGFLRIYATFLDVDMGESLEELTPATKVQLQKRAPKDAPSPLSSKPARPKIKVKVSPRLKKFFFLTLAGIIGLIVLINVVKFVIHGVTRLFRRPVAQQAAVHVPPPPASKPQSVPAARQETKDITVALTAKRNCFIRVRADSKLMFEGILKQGAVETWKAEKEIELKISDGSAVYIEANGSPLPSLTSLRKPIKSLKINASGISVVK